MFLNNLKKEDGKKEIVDMMSDEKLKKQLVIASDIVQDAIDNVLTSEKGAEMWASFFEDPTFVENFAESMSDEQKKLIKSLMNEDRKSTRLNSSHVAISYAVFCLKKKTQKTRTHRLRIQQRHMTVA